MSSRDFQPRDTQKKRSNNARLRGPVQGSSEGKALGPAGQGTETGGDRAGREEAELRKPRGDGTWMAV